MLGGRGQGWTNYGSWAGKDRKERNMGMWAMDTKKHEGRLALEARNVAKSKGMELAE